MKGLFDFLMDLPGISTSDSTKTTHLSIIELGLRVLAKMIDCNTSNMVNVYFKSVYEGLSRMFEGIDHSDDDLVSYRAEKFLQRIQRRLDVGDSIPDRSNVSNLEPATMAYFNMQRDLPGKLSPSGPRHDNDHAEIADIRIMPTHDEIVSPRNEYLPTNDSSIFHLPGIHGRLDREFRLLREDTVGQLRDAVHAKLDSMQNLGTNVSHRNQNGLKKYVYEDASVEDV